MPSIGGAKASSKRCSIKRACIHGLQTRVFSAGKPVVRLLLCLAAVLMSAEPHATEKSGTDATVFKNVMEQISEPRSITTKQPSSDDTPDKAPLRPIDISSPRLTLDGFVKHMNEIHSEVLAVFNSYFNSSRLFLSDEEQAIIARILPRIKEAQRTLDLSELPPALLTDKEINRTLLQLKEVLDRIEIPSLESIPDTAMMEENAVKIWTIPDTEITLGLIEKGHDAGQYKFTPQTVARMAEFYEKVKHLPY
ncbi:MAG: hypothetical protein ACU841_05845, partial [Gammaproteobacteria bacterium]